jgi:hypothetical protein
MGNKKMKFSDHDPVNIYSHLGKYPLLEALLHRRSRRFAKGMHLEGGPLSYRSQQPPEPLTIEEEAALAFAACGVTGYALSELPFQEGREPESGGGNMIVNFIGRTVASGDALHVVALFVINDEGVWLLKRPQDFQRAEIPDIINLARDHKFVEHYKRSRIRISDHRLSIPQEIPYMVGLNKWSVDKPGTTCFLPVSELTALYINTLLAAFEKDYGFFLVDDRNHFRPAGIAQFARSRGGHLYDDPEKGRVGPVSFAETWMHEFAAMELGAMLQNLGLMNQTLGLGGFPFFAAHTYIWFRSLGFRMNDLPVSSIYGLGALSRAILKLLGKDILIPTPLGLEKEDTVLLKPFCPPYYRNMEEAVLAFIDYKYGEKTGVFRDGGKMTAWKNGAQIQSGIPPYSDEAIAATIAYCDYIYNRYGRFPSLNGPFRTVLAYQAHHLDPDFYERFYHKDALTDVQRRHPNSHHNDL